MSPKNVSLAARCPNCFDWWGISSLEWYTTERAGSYIYKDLLFCTETCKLEYEVRGDTGRPLSLEEESSELLKRALLLARDLRDALRGMNTRYRLLLSNQEHFPDLTDERILDQAAKLLEPSA